MIILAKNSLSRRPGGTLDLISQSESDTIALGRLIASCLKAGDVVSLDGDLGAGKTALTKGIAEGLGCRGDVTSPTFTLMMVHPADPGKMALYHFDAYRLGGAEDFCASGLDEFFYSGGVSVIEWGSRIAAILPEDRLEMDITATRPAAPSERQIHVAWPGRDDRLAELAKRLKEGRASARREEGHADTGG